MDTSNISNGLDNLTIPVWNEVIDQMPHITTCLGNKMYRITSLSVALVTFISTAFGNLLIIISHVKFKEFQKHAMHKFILHVAIADLVLLLTLVTYLIEFISPFIFQDPTFCLTRSIFTTVSFSTSITLLTFISVDRFLAVMFPIWHMVESKKTWRIYFLICLVWAGSIFTGVIVIKENMFTEYGYTGKIDGCPIVWYSVETLMAISTSFIMLSIVLNFVCYSCVIKVLLQRKKNFNLKQKHMGKTKLMMCVYSAFALCWLPFLICQTWVFVSPNNVTAKCYREYFFVPGFFNSGLNWIFYGIGNKKYKEAFKQLLTCCRNKGDTS